jgi:hypothetical protein
MIVQKAPLFKLIFAIVLIFWTKTTYAQLPPYNNDESYTSNTPSVNQDITSVYPESKIKSRYRIDIIIPLYLDELVQDNKLTFTGKIPDKAQAGINFYQGIKLAADTLKTIGYTADIYVHDLNATCVSLDQLIASDSFGNSDLIIGFVPAQQVTALATYAAKKQINFVSAFSPSDANIHDNPYFILLNPTLQTNCASIVKSALKLQPNGRILLYKHSRSSNDSNAYNYIVDQSKASDFTEVDCNQLPDSATLASLLDNINTNIILMPILDVAYADKLVQQLHRSFPKYKFEIFGMPSWKSLTTNRRMMDWGGHIGINITQAYYFDPSVSVGQQFATAYRNAYGTQASEIAFRGFELVYWMTDLLQKYGTLFNDKTEDDGMAIFTRFDLKPKLDKAQRFLYIENKHLYLYHYQAGATLVQQ